MIKRLLMLVFPLTLLIMGLYFVNKPNKVSLIDIQNDKISNVYSWNKEVIVERSMSKNYINVEFNANTVNFDLDKYNLNQKAKEKLTPLIKELSERNKLTISGHTCDVGNEEYNNELSSRRAEAVKLFIQYINPSINNISTNGYGKSYPKVNNDSEYHKKINRRVEIKIEEDKIDCNLNDLLEKYEWLIVLIGLIGTIVTIANIIKKWNK